MRNLRFYSISLAIHAVVLGSLACLIAWMGFTPPDFSLRSGSGSGIDGVDVGDAVVLEGELLPCSQTLDVRINPAPAMRAAVRSELTEAQSVESRRLFEPSVETGPIAQKVEPPIPEPPPALPPLPTVKMAPRVVETVETPPPGPPEPNPGNASVDVGELLKGSVGAQTALSSEDGPSGSQRGALQLGGRSGGGGGPEGLPTGLNANIRPPYPPEAEARGIEGRVMLRVMIDEDGAVRSVKVETSSGDASLDQSALVTVRDRWHFGPAHRNGVPVECEVLVPIRFRMRAGG